MKLVGHTLRMSTASSSTAKSVWLTVRFENRAFFVISHPLTNIKNFEQKCTVLVHFYTFKLHICCHRCSHTYVHRCSHTYVHRCLHIYVHRCSHINVHRCSHIYIQGVPGGMCETSGECSLCYNIPI